MKALKSERAKQMSREELVKYLYRFNGYMDMTPDLLEVTNQAAKALEELEIKKDNLTLIRERYQDKFGKMYADNTGQIFMFIGIVIAEDDYYYGLMNLYDKKWTLSSCVGYLEESGYEEVVK